MFVKQCIVRYEYSNEELFRVNIGEKKNFGRILKLRRDLITKINRFYFKNNRYYSSLF